MRSLSFSVVLGLSLLQFSHHSAHAAAVSSSTPESSQAAMAVLNAGGNAIDAACAAVFVLNVTQPHFTGLGSGGFALIHLKDKGDIYLDFRESAPASVTPRLFYQADGKTSSNRFENSSGPKSVGVPGTVAGCGKMVLENGKLGWKKVFAPAIQLAKNGFTISQLFQEELADQWKRISPYEFTKSLLQGGSGTGLKKGETLKQPILADTFELLAEKGPDSFYKGEIGKKWLKEAQEFGVPISQSDLENYQVDQRELIPFDIGKLKGVTVSAPSSSGLMVAAVLRYLNHYYTIHKLPEPESPTRFIVEIEAKSYFAKMRSEKMSDPTRMKFSVSQFLNSSEEKKAWKDLDRRIKSKLLTSAHSGHMNLDERKSQRLAQHTAHVSVVDDFGNAVALTSSVGNIFGSGIILPKSGFVLNSTLGDFEGEEGQLNSPKALVRPLSNMSPVFLYEGKPSDQALVGVLGAAGGPLIPSGIVDFVQNYYVHGMDKSKAIRFPRVHSDNAFDVAIERHIPETTIEGLKKRGYQVQPIEIMWAVLEGIVRQNSKQPWEAVAETRYDGLGLVSQ